MLMSLNHNPFSQKKVFYIEQKLDRTTVIKNTLFLSLFTLALHLFLLSLDTNVLLESIPEFLLESYFSTFSLYNIICFIYFTVTFISRYTYLTFAEVNENKWYNFIKAGYSPYLLIFMKLGMRIIEIIFSYTMGYICVFILSTFLKYPLTVDYLIPLYTVGILDLIVFTTVVMVVSLFIRQKVNARYVILTVFISMLVLRITSGYYQVITDRTLMTSVLSIIDPSLSNYFIYVVIIAVISIAFVIYGARRSSNYTSFYFYEKDMDYDKDVKIVMKQGTKYQLVKSNNYVDDHQRHHLFDILVNAAMTFVIISLVIFNLIVLAVSVTSLNRNWNFLNIYPYVFQSDTMEPALEYNDLAFFKGVESDEVENQDIILYRANDTTVAIARVVEMDDEQWIVDYDHYPDNTDPELLREKIAPQQVEGIFMAASRWLGLLVLFANTMIGRLFMLILPSILIFFYQPIIHFLDRFKQE